MKRQRSPSPTPSNPPPSIFQSPQHQNLLVQSNQNPMTGLSPVTSNTSTAVFQSHMFSPNKKSRVVPQPNLVNASQSPLTTLNSYMPVLVGQPQQAQQPRLSTPYVNSPQHSAFSAYPSHFLNSLQSQQQKAPLLSVPNNQIHASPQALSFAIPSRLQHQGIRT